MNLEFDKFRDACQHGNLVPIYKRIFSDQLTPVLAYRCLVKEDDREAPSFLFESVENSESGNHVVRNLSIFSSSCYRVGKSENILFLDCFEEKE